MNNKGFTLIELLGVIIILSLLILLVLPSITNSVKNYSKDTDELMLSMVEDAAKLYVEDNSSLYTKQNGNSYCIELNELVDKEYLKLPIKQNDIDITTTKSVQVTYENGFDYEIVESDECVEIIPICKLSENGDVAPIGISVGDKYTCKVKENMEADYINGYNFYVLSVNEDGTTNLIMERNIYYDSDNDTSFVANSTNTGSVTWYLSKDNSYGPITAMDYLYNATKDWNNVPNIQMNYKDEGNNYGTIITTNGTTKITKKDNTSVLVLTNQEGYANLKARMPYYSEVINPSVGCTTNLVSCPLYMVNYLHKSSYYTTENGKINIDGIYGYWTLSSYQDASYYAWLVHLYGFLHYDLDVNDDSGCGVRPVITLEL